MTSSSGESVNATLAAKVAERLIARRETLAACRRPRAADRVLATGSSDRAGNMVTFANAALTLLLETLEA